MRLRALCALAVAVACLPAPALAGQAPSLTARFEPNRLGASTTVLTDFDVGAAATAAGSPLVGVELRLPAGLTGGFNTLGLASCAPGALERSGPGVCPADAFLGHGSAEVLVPLGAGAVYEQVALDVLSGPPVEGHTGILFYADGTKPVISRLILPGALLGDSGPFGARLQTTIPLIAGLPGGPDAALVSMQASIGPRGLTYYRTVKGVRHSFVPEGFTVPLKCPVGGFPFALKLTFADGTSASAANTEPCPRAAARSRP